MSEIYLHITNSSIFVVVGKLLALFIPTFSIQKVFPLFSGDGERVKDKSSFQHRRRSRRRRNNTLYLAVCLMVSKIKCIKLGNQSIQFLYEFSLFLFRLKIMCIVSVVWQRKIGKWENWKISALYNLSIFGFSLFHIYLEARQTECITLLSILWLVRDFSN